MEFFSMRIFLQKVWMDQFLLPVLWALPIQERQLHFLVLFSFKESYHFAPICMP
jgi:hypothetical protein